MYPLFALWRKEWLALMRDKHGLAALFVMPAVFILIMSLALQDSFSPAARLELGYVIVDLDQSSTSAALVKRLRAQSTLQDHGNRSGESQAKEEIRQGQHAFALLIPAGFGRSLQADQQASTAPHKLRLLTDPTIPNGVELSFRNQILAALGTQRANEVLLRLQKTPLGGNVNEIRIEDWQRQLETVAIKADTAHADAALPSAVQQSVPAWLIFSMFFVVVPMSAIFITERQHGTLQRLRTQHVSYALILAGKLLPFFIVNQIQALLMILVGRYLVPQFGGDALVLPSGVAQIAGLWCMAATASLAAVSWALCIASLVRTSEQATVIGGVGNILMGAMGGIMVPKFIMPAQMQSLTQISPMAWALDGFHEIMLRSGSVADVMPYIGSLLLFATATLFLAILTSALAVRYRS